MDKLYEILHGEPWDHSTRGPFSDPPVATDPLQVALVGKRHLAEVGDYFGEVRGSGPEVAQRSALLFEEVAALGGPGADAEAMAELRAERGYMLDAYLLFFRQLQPGEEVVYTLT
ncbi:hypothetical protein [Rubrivirga sp. IMCC45206]|uniref:hypothetical protein n=1 Tax=Rubrivirga sp. IMCC45206 TaxID=3391614 RepID=UPI0039902692